MRRAVMRWEDNLALLRIQDARLRIILEARDDLVRPLDLNEFTIDEQLRDDFARAATAHRDEVARTLRRCGAPLMTLRTDRDWIADIVRFVASRRRGALAGSQ